MIVDSSALIAILRKEPEAAAFAGMLLAAQARVSAGTLIEALIVAERDGGADDLQELLEWFDARIEAVDSRQIAFALSGFRKYGKGRHPAALNFGDLFAYALAKAVDEPLLFKGEDFAQTDLRPAV